MLGCATQLYHVRTECYVPRIRYTDLRKSTKYCESEVVETPERTDANAAEHSTNGDETDELTQINSRKKRKRRKHQR